MLMTGETRATVNGTPKFWDMLRRAAPGQAREVVTSPLPIWANNL